tara:strand:+ start:304 stop:621 length:318 start_codon:yes stop_codon:yes gene_type:complete
MGLNVFNFANPKTKKIVSVISMDDAHEHLDDLLMDTDQIEEIVGEKIDWDDELSTWPPSELFRSIERGDFGNEARSKFLINCEAAMILALADKHFTENPTEDIKA